MHDGLGFVTVRGDFHGTGSWGGEKRSGGLLAYGMPIQDFIPDGKKAPTTSPESILTGAGPWAYTAAKRHALARRELDRILRESKRMTKND